MNSATGLLNYFFSLVSLRAETSVADPDPPDPHIFGAPGYGSGSISQRYGSGCSSGSLSKNSKKNLDFYCFVTSF
jgi:hypothetical protein